MPKTRDRVTQPGAKSVAARIKNKIGGRKSRRGTGQMSTDAMLFLQQVRKRDKNKLRRALASRGVVLP